MLKLNNAEAPLSDFFASGVLRQDPTLGPILWQFPPNFRFNPEKLPRLSSICCLTRHGPGPRPAAAGTITG